MTLTSVCRPISGTCDINYPVSVRNVYKLSIMNALNLLNLRGQTLPVQGERTPQSLYAALTT